MPLASAPTSRGQRLEDPRTGEWKVRGEVCMGEPQYRSIVARVRDQQDHHLHAVVTALESEPTRHGLDVMEPRLRVDGHQPPGPTDPRVPRPEVTGELERDLRSPGQPRREAYAELRQERHLTLVPIGSPAGKALRGRSSPTAEAASARVS